MTEREQTTELVRDLGKLVERNLLEQSSAPAIAVALLKRLDEISPGTIRRCATALCRPEQITLPADPFELR